MIAVPRKEEVPAGSRRVLLLLVSATLAGVVFLAAAPQSHATPARLSAAASGAAAIPTVEIARGVQMPVMNVGTCCGSDVLTGVPAWLEAGGRGIDTAFDYGGVGEKFVPGGLQTDLRDLMRRGTWPREQLFISTKVPGGLNPPLQFGSYPFGKCVAGQFDSPAENAYQQVLADLDELGVDQLDLVLLHAPCEDRALNRQLWAAMERALARNLTRSIGVSNYNRDDLADLLRHARVKPSVNECQFSLSQRSEEDLAFAQAEGIRVVAYGVSKGCPTEDPSARAIASRHGVSVTQVCLRWAVQRGVLLAVGLGTSERVAAHASDNAAVFQFALTTEEMAELEASVPIEIPVCPPGPLARGGCVA